MTLPQHFTLVKLVHVFDVIQAGGVDEVVVMVLAQQTLLGITPAERPLSTVVCRPTRAASSAPSSMSSASHGAARMKMTRTTFGHCNEDNSPFSEVKIMRQRTEIRYKMCWPGHASKIDDVLNNHHKKHGQSAPPTSPIDPWCEVVVVVEEVVTTTRRRRRRIED